MGVPEPSRNKGRLAFVAWVTFAVIDPPDVQVVLAAAFTIVLVPAVPLSQSVGAPTPPGDCAKQEVTKRRKNKLSVVFFI
ncbi:hypothetical protein D3C86_1313240 [compost metagenome]